MWASRERQKGKFMTVDIKALAQKQKDYMIQMRRELHRHPELSNHEFETRKRIVRELERMGIEYELLEGTGILGRLEGGKPGKNKVLRADIDALPIQEAEEHLKGPKETVSENAGVSHACGHDAHMAMLLGTIQALLEVQEEIEGTVYFCFEEAEENGSGIDTMMKALEPLDIDECFAMHVDPDIDVGQLNLEPGPRIAGAIGISLKLKGKAGHGSRPDQAINPIVPAAHIITNVDSALRNQLNPEKTVTLSFGHLAAGDTYNSIPGEAILEGSARFFDVDEGLRTLEIITDCARSIAAIHKCEVSFGPMHRLGVVPVINAKEVVERVSGPIQEAWGEGVLKTREKWFASETFSRYLSTYKGAMGFLGVGNPKKGFGGALHNANFDLDEDALPLGCSAELSFVLS